MYNSSVLMLAIVMKIKYEILYYQIIITYCQ